MPNIATKGIRTDIDHYFKYLFEYGQSFSKLTHNRVLTLRLEDYEVIAEAIKEYDDLLELSDDVQCIGLWPGKNFTDWFTFTAKEFKKYAKKKGG